MEKRRAIELVDTIRRAVSELNKGGYRIMATGYVEGFAMDSAGRTYREIYIEIEDQSLRIMHEPVREEQEPVSSEDSEASEVGA